MPEAELVPNLPEKPIGHKPAKQTPRFHEGDRQDEEYQSSRALIQSKVNPWLGTIKFAAETDSDLDEIAKAEKIRQLTTQIDDAVSDKAFYLYKMIRNLRLEGKSQDEISNEVERKVTQYLINKFSVDWQKYKNKLMSKKRKELDYGRSAEALARQADRKSVERQKKNLPQNKPQRKKPLWQRLKNKMKF